MSTIHILFSDSGAGSLKEVIRGRGSDDEVISLPDDLSVGPIRSGDIRERVRWFDVHYPMVGGDWSWLPEEIEFFWRRAGTAIAERLIWYAPRSAKEVAGLSAYAETLGNRARRPIDRCRCAAFGRLYVPTAPEPR